MTKAEPNTERTPAPARFLGRLPPCQSASASGAGVVESGRYRHGFLPGQGHPPGTASFNTKPREFREFVLWLQEWLSRRVSVRLGRKVQRITRLEAILRTLAEQKPEVLLHYAYGKPLETVQTVGHQQQNVEIVLRVREDELP